MTTPTFLITGAAGAIGQACANRFLAQGARLFLTDLERPAGLDDHPDCAFHPADCTRPEAVEAAMQAALARFGQIDGAVLAAGVSGPVARIEDITPGDLDAVLEVNLKGALWWTQACLRHMKPRGAGSIVALSSISGVVGSASLAAYTISKHALVGLVRAAALEAGPYGVRINAVCPGPVASPMMDGLEAAMAALDPQRAAAPGAAARGIPLQRYATPSEVAAMVAFLCGDQAGACHGGTYMVDGGFTAK